MACYVLLGGATGQNYGNFAEVSFRWSYPCTKKPVLVLINGGKVVHCTQMDKLSSAQECAETATAKVSGYDSPNEYY